METVERTPLVSGGLRIEGPSRDTLADRAYRSIRIAIINRELVPDRYYSEAWLAGLLGVSRTPTHYALLQLELEGIVEIVAQRGFRVRQIPQSEFEEFYELRILLETNVLRKLAPAVEEESLATLRDFLERQRRVVEDPITFQDLDEGFHRFMAETAGLHRTAAIIHSLRGILWLGTSTRPASEREAVVDEHAAIVEGLAARDPEAAVAALVRHLRTSQERYKAMVEETEASAAS
ncbi:MAG TPA: GntR family transcriptional regulator [Candidatus Dormibacteraeota bacterium]|nr:GntR family transcriptional regulator [Candidatus Dormibacteraeota bacterium]